NPPAWMLRLIRQRDRGCTFPGCGSRAFTVVHHLRPWSAGGPTTLGNTTLQCAFHHKLVHELGWRAERGEGGVLRWYRPDGTTYRPGPAPPRGPT
ncbi:MAG TPA: HNH endonuclease signature motif containing protein, partial [Actinomycetota bacterium]|nr:HNH endonuclease signature motif containing protein [Actinomycetota bacterium]